MTNSEMMSQRVEKEVRCLIGDVQMQIIVLRAALDLAQQQPQPGEPIRTPPPPPPSEPIPPQPEQDEPPPKSARTNGATNLRG